MRWLLVSSRHHPVHGGIGACVARFCAEAHAAGWEVDLVTRPSDVLPAGVRVHPVETADADPAFASRVPALRRIERIRPYRYGLWSLAVAEKLLALDGGYDAIELVDCQAEGYVSLASAAVRARWAGTPMIVGAGGTMEIVETLSGFDPDRFGRSIYHDWERAAVRLADGVWAPSRCLLARLAGVRSGVVIPNPVARAEPAQEPEAGARDIVLVGALEPNKGVETWVHSLDTVLPAAPETRAVLLGPDTPTGPGGSSMHEHLRRLLGAETRSRVSWGGAAPHEEVLRAIERAALVVVPSRFESFSYVAADAVMRGRPVVVSDEVGLLEHVPSLRAAAVDDPDALAEAQLAVLADAAAAQRRAHACRDELLAACAPERHLEAKAEFVRQLRGGGAGEGARGGTREGGRKKAGGRAAAAVPAAVGEQVLPGRDDPEEDALERMRRFLRHVEMQESAAEPGPPHPHAEEAA